MGLLQGAGIGDALAALFTGKGVDHEVRGAHQPVFPRGRRLDGQEFRHQGRVQAAPQVGEYVWQHQMRLGTIPLDRGKPAGIHHGQVGPHPATELFISAAQLLLQEFQRPSDPGRNSGTSTGRGFREPLGQRAVNGRPQGRPRQRLGPWADRVRLGDEVGHLQTRSSACQPMLEVSAAFHHRLS